MMTDDGPLISVIVACRDVANFIGPALNSALCQTHRALDIVVVDDGSRDATPQIVSELARSDRRIRLLSGPGRGPAAARNLAFKAARGDWLAILDGDDLFHPRRLQTLVARGREAQADIVADALIAFKEADGRREAWPFLGSDTPGEQQLITLMDLVRPSRIKGSESPLGYLKPLFRKDYLDKHALQYRETLVIGEDFDLLARAVAGGARFTYVDAPYYFYRRHSASISHRLTVPQIDQMIAASADLIDAFGGTLDPGIVKALRARILRLRRYRHAQELIDHLKARSPVRAVLTGLSNPSAAQLAGHFLGEGLSRRLRKAVGQSNDVRAVRATKSLWITDQKNADSLRSRLSHLDGLVLVDDEGNKTNPAPFTAQCEVLSSSLGVSEINTYGVNEEEWLGYVVNRSHGEIVNEYG